MDSQDDRAIGHGRLLKEWMADRGLNAPALTEAVRLQGQQISPDYIRKLTRGERELARTDVSLRESIRKALRLTSEDWERETGLVTVAPYDPDPTPPRRLTHAERRGWKLPEPVEPEIPDTLQEAADKYGHGSNAPLSERRWLLELAKLDFREEPETPEDWLAVYARLSKIINPK